MFSISKKLSTGCSLVLLMGSVAAMADGPRDKPSYHLKDGITGKTQLSVGTNGVDGRIGFETVDKYGRKISGKEMIQFGKLNLGASTSQGGRIMGEFQLDYRENTFDPGLYMSFGEIKRDLANAQFSVLSFGLSQFERDGSDYALKFKPLQVTFGDESTSMLSPGIEMNANKVLNETTSINGQVSGSLGGFEKLGDQGAYKIELGSKYKLSKNVDVDVTAYTMGHAIYDGKKKDVNGHATKEEKNVTGIKGGVTVGF